MPDEVRDAYGNEEKEEMSEVIRQNDKGVVVRVSGRMLNKSTH
jgi:hypothetical protein